MVGTFPFFVAVRQLLEHRDEFATKGTDYFKVAHGAINRLFGTGPLASTLGGAGFNRHLLHHFAPQIPSTRLKEFEEYLMNTAFADYIKPRQTTYIRTFRKLVQY
jgi:fatty acid desaturase